MPIILGRESAPASPFGFPSAEAPASGGLIEYTGEAPVTIIAPTGSGKGRDFIVPACLTYPGPLFAIDIKGELSAVCTRRRKEMGHQVAVIDPFSVTGKQSDRLDPFEIFKLTGSSLEADAEMLASILGDGHGSTKEPFWPDTATSLLSGLIAMAAAIDGERKGFDFVRNYLFSDDTVYAIATLVDTCKHRNHFAFRELTAFLEHGDHQTRPSVLSTARTFMRALNSPSVANCLQNATIHLADIVSGAPLDIFLVLPPEKLASHACFLRLIVGTVLTAIMQRRQPPAQRTLFIVDEAAQLGEKFEPILTATTLLRGFGLQLITVWQDMAQIKSRYKEDWATILNNSGAVLSFGQGHYAACKEAADFLGMEVGELMRMAPTEAALAVHGEGVRKITRLNYLKDELFEGMFDENPMYRRSDLGR
jgi:type IV secretion system protein VirD4